MSSNRIDSLYYKNVLPLTQFHEKSFLQWRSVRRNAFSVDSVYWNAYLLELSFFFIIKWIVSVFPLSFQLIPEAQY